MTLLYYYLIAINALTLIFYGVDKLKARHQWWRIPEWTLLTLAALGGSPCALIAMHLFHHKTRKPAFRFGVPAIFIIQSGVALYIILS